MFEIDWELTGQQVMLHARRLVLDAGDLNLDVTAEIPPAMARAAKMAGFSDLLENLR